MFQSLIKYISLILVFTTGSIVYSQSITITQSVGDSFLGSTMIGGAGVSGINYGALDFMNVYHDDQTTPIIYRSFIGFNLSNIPLDAIITSAELILTPKDIIDTVNYSYYVERVDTTWHQDSINWDNQEGTFTSDRVICDTINAQSDTAHHIDVKAHVQNMVNYPYNNHGWAIRLDDENVSGLDYGISFFTANHVNTNYRPKLEITYVLPISIIGEVTHCTNGNNDGAINLSVSGGTNDYSYYSLNRVDRDTAFLAQEKLTFIQSSSSGIDNLSIDAVNLEPGLYRVIIRDVLWTGNNDYSNAHFKLYYQFLIGEEGEITNVLLADTWTIEDVTIGNNIGAFAPSNDFANLQYKYVRNDLQVAHTGTNTIGTPQVNAYEMASLMNLNIDFKPDLTFSKTDVNFYGTTRYRQTYTSSNEAVYTIVTEPWNDDIVTWNCRPNIDTNYRVISAKTATPNGYSNQRQDTVDIAPLIEYWKTNPNYGFELALLSYNYPTLSTRSQRSLIKNNCYVELSFTVEPVASTFDETIGTGEILVNAPNGTLPYTYLISYDSIPPLDSIWNDIKDSTLLDSAYFFDGKESTRSFNFSGLESNRYFVAAYDNNGLELMQKEVYLSPEIELFDNINLIVEQKNVLKVSSGDTIGFGTLMANLSEDGYGGVLINIEELGKILIGFKSANANSILGPEDLFLV